MDILNGYQIKVFDFSKKLEVDLINALLATGLVTGNRVDILNIIPAGQYVVIVYRKSSVARG